MAGVALCGLGGHHVVLAVPGRARDGPLLQLPALEQEAVRIRGYGVWGRESPRFIDLFFRFVRTHRRVGLISYYQSALLKPEFRLSTHPVSRAALRRKLRSPRFVSFAPEFARR